MHATAFVAAHAANVDRISATTGVPVATLQAQRASTGLGWGSLEKAHLLANASGQSFDNIVALHQSGQGWGRIARNNGLNVGTLVSNAHRSSNATSMLRTGEQCMARAGRMLPKATALEKVRHGVSVTANPVSAARMECVRRGT